MRNGLRFPCRRPGATTDGATEEGSRAGFWTSP